MAHDGFPSRLLESRDWEAGMDGNSPKPTETVDAWVCATEVLRAWLDQEGGNQRIPQILDLLAERTVASLVAGHPAPAFDADGLRTLYFATHGGCVPDTPATRWLSSSNVRRWWEQRRERIEAACRERGIGVVPELFLQVGGGRSNATLYRFDFRSLGPATEQGELLETNDPVGQEQPGRIRYAVEPAEAAWWLRPIIGTEPFRMRSWRGYVLLTLTLAEVVFLMIVWGLILQSMRSPQTVTGSDLVTLLVASMLTVVWWRALRPILRLPYDRVTVASDPYLAWSQFHGQFRLTRDAKSKVAGGWFRLVRHWGYCPLCSGEVEVLSGGAAFPGRLVGRCSDSPLEHVYSFDPVNLTGIHLTER